MERGLSNQIIRQLDKDEGIPYDLLLLADPTEEAINRYIFNSDIYVLVHGNDIIGVFVLQAISRYEVEIKNIAVATKYQGRGLGRFMLRNIALRAKGKGFKAITVGTGDASTRQLRFYQDEGFKLFGVKKEFFC